MKRTTSIITIAKLFEVLKNDGLILKVDFNARVSGNHEVCSRVFGCHGIIICIVTLRKLLLFNDDYAKLNEFSINIFLFIWLVNIMMINCITNFRLLVKIHSKCYYKPATKRQDLHKKLCQNTTSTA